jgi:CBS domain containing-hemolysin-like protein
MVDPFAYVLIVVLALLISCSAFFGAAETAYSSMNRIRVKNYAQQGNKKAQKALDVSENYDKLLTTLLIGNNFVNITIATLSAMLFVIFIQDANLAAAVSTVVITLVLLTFGEITPKTMAMDRAERWAMAFARPTKALVFLFTPLSVLFVGLKRILSRNMDDDDVPLMTHDELKVMIDEIEEEGSIGEHESDLIKSAIEFNDITVGEMYTHRLDVVSIEIKSDKMTIKKTFRDSGFSRIPVYVGTIDHIIGVLYSKDFYNHYLEQENAKIENLLRPVKFVPTAMKISALLTDLQKSQMHMAVVVDESGGTMGIVTLEDIVEELIGEIWDESDEIEEEVTENSDGTYKALGGANIHDVIEESEIDLDIEGYEGHTLSGFIYYKLGRIPLNREAIEMENVRIIVKLMKNRRIKEVLLVKKKKRTSDDVPGDIPDEAPKTTPKQRREDSE